MRLFWERVLRFGCDKPGGRSLSPSTAQALMAKDKDSVCVVKAKDGRTLYYRRRGIVEKVESEEKKEKTEQRLARQEKALEKAKVGTKKAGVLQGRVERQRERLKQAIERLRQDTERYTSAKELLEKPTKSKKLLGSTKEIEVWKAATDQIDYSISEEEFLKEMKLLREKAIDASIASKKLTKQERQKQRQERQKQKEAEQELFESAVNSIAGLKERNIVFKTEQSLPRFAMHVFLYYMKNFHFPLLEGLNSLVNTNLFSVDNRTMGLYSSKQRNIKLDLRQTSIQFSKKKEKGEQVFTVGVMNQVKSSLYHESGHALHQKIWEERKTEKGEKAYKSLFKLLSHFYEISSVEQRNWTTSNAYYKKKDSPAGFISKYSEKDIEETFAELVSAYFSSDDERERIKAVSGLQVFEDLESTLKLAGVLPTN